MQNLNSKDTFTFNRPKLVRIFFFATFAFILYLLFRLAEPFLTALLLSGMLAISFFPINRRMRGLTTRPGLTALILTIAIFLAVVIPLTWFIWFLIREADQLLPTIESKMNTIKSLNTAVLYTYAPAALHDTLDGFLSIIDRLNIDPKIFVLKYAGIIVAKITSAGSWIAQNIFIGLLNMLVFIVSLFVWFRDGENLFNWGMSLLPMEDEHKKAVSKSAYDTFMAVVTGVFLTAFAQGFVAMIGFLIAGVQLPVLLGVFTMIASLLGASFLITLPVALFTFTESTGWGIFLLLWGPLLVGFMDNFLKPMLIGTKARMPLLLVFFSIIGGIKAFGLVGLVAGPIIMASFLTFVNIYKKVSEFKNPPDTKTESV
jgi:predicted PurR-regulated permease PerM